jgi:hypothetical protein
VSDSSQPNVRYVVTPEYFDLPGVPISQNRTYGSHRLARLNGLGVTRQLDRLATGQRRFARLAARIRKSAV